MEIQVTTDYKLFKFRSDNIHRLDKHHVEELKKSISKNNLLHLKPIIINQSFEVIDGQHRLMAAKELGVPVYYVQERAGAEEMILFNSAQKNWKIEDYLIHYSMREFPEYVKLKKFVDECNMPLNLAILLTLDCTKKAKDEFRQGNYRFDQALLYEHVHTIKDTISLLRQYMNSQRISSLYAYKFWKAMLMLVRHPFFEKERWFKNIGKLGARFLPQVTTKEYLERILYIYNWKYKEVLEIKC